MAGRKVLSLRGSLRGKTVLDGAYPGSSPVSLSQRITWSRPLLGRGTVRVGTLARRRLTVRFRNGAPEELTCEARSEAHWTASILRGEWEFSPCWEELENNRLLPVSVCRVGKAGPASPLSPRVRGSSRWRRTRNVLGLCLPRDISGGLAGRAESVLVTVSRSARDFLDPATVLWSAVSLFRALVFGILKILGQHTDLTCSWLLAGPSSRPSGLRLQNH